jgi:hypothetical protein
MTFTLNRNRQVQPWREWLVSGNWKDFPTATWERETGCDFEEGTITKSESHPYHELGRHDNFDIGGDFRLFKRGYSESGTMTGPHHFALSGPWNEPLNDGGSHIYCAPKARLSWVSDDVPGSLLHDGPPHSSSLELDAWGAKAIERCIPTNPVAEAQVLAGNTLQKGLPKIPFRHWEGITKSAKYAGDNYLNASFGWKPFISDLRHLGHAVVDSDKILSKYHAESGKLLHRSYHFPTETTSEVEHRGDGFIPAPFGDSDYFRMDKHVGRLTVTSKTTIRRWFKGAFTYYLPKLGSVAGNYADARKLLGAGLTPELVWELTPWSWAINWFVDTGTVIHNLSQFAQDGLVMPYAYIMEHSKTVTNYQLDDVGFKSYTGLHSFSQTFTSECKQRKAATPYGFGANFDGFTDRQTAIIAALGLSHRSGAGTINPN